MNWIDRKETEPNANDKIEMKLGYLTWKGRIWEPCPSLDPVYSPMPTHWRPLHKELEK